MKRLFLICSLTAIFLPFSAPALAVDHDNLDSSRPLRIEDADSIAFRERAMEYGLTPTRAHQTNSLGLTAEYLYGFAMNSHFSVDFDPYVGSHIATSNRKFDVGDVGLGVFRNLNRETLTRPALAIRADLYLPTGRDERRAGVRLRGILSRTFNQYNRFHVNVDAHVRTQPRNWERAFQPAITLGVSRPMGYPTRFDRTFVAELGARANEELGQGTVFSTGVGLRQQITVRSVLDAGITYESAATRGGAAHDTLRIVAGYSTQF